MRFKTGAGGEGQCFFLPKGDGRIDICRQNTAVFHQHLAIHENGIDIAPQY